MTNKHSINALLICSVFIANTVNAEQLTATIVGSGSPIFNENRSSASVLISNGNTNILVDMGNGTQANLNTLGLKARDLDSLVFTHHHLDHNEEFAPILIGSLLGKEDLSIVGPPNTKKFTETYLDLYEEDISYRLGKTQRTLETRKKAFTVKDIEGGESFKIDDINVSTIEVPHTIHTIAYRFDYEGQSIIITGDLTYSDSLPTLAKNADYMIIDSGGMIMSQNGLNNRKKKKSGNNNSVKNSDRKTKKNGKHKAHLDLDDSSTLAAQSEVKNLVYTHFLPGNIDKDASLKEIQKNYKGNVIFGEDLMLLSTVINSSNSATTEQINQYSIVDTGQVIAYSNDSEIATPTTSDDFYGQDANYTINQPSYTNNQDGTIIDNVTGLMWQQGLTEKLTYDEAIEKVKTFNLAGYTDWRIANIKELYSLIQFSGSVKGERALTPFIDTNYFTQPLGNEAAGEREIDAQVWTSTEYVGKTMRNDDTIFGVNFVDGRIKGYPKYNPRTQDANKMYFRFVRDNETYGQNNFSDIGDGSIADTATGLMWQQTDNSKGLRWEEALQYCENLNLSGNSDWRLPNAKELQSIVDYSRSPETSSSAAINPIFQISSITNEGGEKDYPYFWTSTTHLDGPNPEGSAVYVSFGKALGKMRETIMDVHGAGSQRSDPKIGEAMSRGPQGDMIRVENYVRCVSGGVLDSNPAQKNTFTYKNSDSHSLKTNTNQATVGEKTKRAERKSNQKTVNRFVQRLDKNGDGKVSSTEFKGKEAQFNHLDKNGDGYISLEEAPTGPPNKKKQ
ncbi:Lcl domain-containing protein [Vibrio sp. WJH972]